jgi:hypothetical protein
MTTARTIALLLLLTTIGCTTTITPPTNPKDPVTIHLLDHGRHPSLILPRSDGTFVRYVFGDWQWYALADTGFLQAFDAMLLPSQGALGRRILNDADDFDYMKRRDPAEHTHVLTVSRADVAALDERLDTLFAQNASTLRVNKEYDLDFVHHPDRYHFFHNCNHVMKQWLQSLHCRVHGAAIQSHWNVKHR